MSSAISAAMNREDDLARKFRGVRALSLTLAAPLSVEDQQVQSMADVSPTKWHLAHITWFFETFVLKPNLPGYTEYSPDFGYLFNSYYEAVGPRHARPERGLLSRPSLDEVVAYRDHVDAAMADLIGSGACDEDQLRSTVELGLNHEQQHQELSLMDIKHVLSCSPLAPRYAEPPKTAPRSARPAGPARWHEFGEGVRWIGHDGDGFAFDNEGPRHRVFVEPFRLADRLVTNREYQAFIDDGGYSRAEFWLSDGWSTVHEHDWEMPLYWRRRGDETVEFTLTGERPLDPDVPVSHVSFYEATAYAAWARARLPTEAEWEIAAADSGAMAGEGRANLLGSGTLHPAPCGSADGERPRQMIGDLWEWTQSAYAPYPRFRPGAGAIGEYSGKFMCNQMVLRGGCCATPPGHIRATYRNFFYPQQRWMFSGIRLAQDL